MKTGRWLPWLVWGASLILYGATAAPSIIELFDDSLEFQLVAPTFGIAHPTGYPLYVLLGGLWSRVLFPVGNWAWRMNLFSALAAATAVALVYVLACRLTTIHADKPNPWAGLAAAFTFGLGPIWWAQATIAEVYALHSLFVAAILFVTVQISCRWQVADGRWQVPLATRHPVTLSPCHLVTFLFFLIGLSLAHHRTTFLLLPALAIYLLWSIPGLWRPRRAWVGWVLALATPLLLYLWLPLRAATGVIDLHGSYVNSWQGFWNHVLARHYTSFFAENALTVQRTPGDWLALWQQQTGLIGLGFGLLGLIGCWSKDQLQNKTWLFVILVLVSNLLFALNYRVYDAEVFLLPALLAFALLVGAGVGLIQRLLAGWPRIATGVQVAGVLALAIGAGRAPAINRSQAWAVHDYAVTLAKVDFPPNSRLVALEGEATALKYMQQAEGLGRNAVAVVANDPEQRRQAIAALVSQGLPTYLTRELDGIAPLYSFSGDGPLVRVWPRGQAQAPPPQVATDLLFAAGQLRLEGYDLVKLDQAGGSALRIAFYWRPLAPLTQTLKLSLRLQTLDGAPLHGADGQPVQVDQFPLRLVANTPNWLPDEIVRDVHDLPLPPGVVGQPAQLLVILYDADTLAEVGVWRIEFK